MSREATGSIRWRGKAAQFRITIAGKHYAVPIRCHGADEARDRCVLLTSVGRRLHASGHGADTQLWLANIAGAADGKDLDDLLDGLDDLCAGRVELRDVAKSGTFAALAERWTSGELARLYRDHIKAIDHRANKSYLNSHILPHVGGVPVVAFTEEHGALVMSKLPDGLEVTTRRHVAQIMSRLMSLAVWPLKLIQTNPLPRGWLPPIPKGRAKGWLYPDEDARLLACRDIPLSWRVFYGFLHREGCRRSEAILLRWLALDLVRGTIHLDVNKTDEPRMWALDAGTVAGMRAWQAMVAPEDLSEHVFLDESGEPMDGVDKHFAARFRRHLQAAGITRSELFVRSAHRQPIRLHDCRATFITVSLAGGRSETWVQDRTGHKSSVMINRYRRAARTLEELRLGMKDFLPLDQAIPEFREPAAEGKRLRLVR